MLGAIIGDIVGSRFEFDRGNKSKEFEQLCGKFIEGQTFDEYSAYVYRYLIESSWRYTPEEAAERMEWDEYWLNDYYSGKEPVSSCAAEVGFGCG